MSERSVFTVTLLPSGQRFEARADESLLKAGLRALAPLRSSCRNGTCRTCLCKMTTGRVRYQIEWPGVSAEEKAEGYTLPCVAIAESDLVIEVSGVQEI